MSAAAASPSVLLVRNLPMHTSLVRIGGNSPIPGISAASSTGVLAENTPPYLLMLHQTVSLYKTVAASDAHAFKYYVPDVPSMTCKDTGKRVPMKEYQKAVHAANEKRTRDVQCYVSWRHARRLHELRRAYTHFLPRGVNILPPASQLIDEAFFHPLAIYETSNLHVDYFFVKKDMPLLVVLSVEELCKAAGGFEKDTPVITTEHQAYTILNRHASKLDFVGWMFVQEHPALRTKYHVVLFDTAQSRDYVLNHSPSKTITVERFLENVG